MRQAREQRCGCEETNLCRREFDREWEAIQPDADYSGPRNLALPSFV
jgi:hypothetical protein